MTHEALDVIILLSVALIAANVVALPYFLFLSAVALASMLNRRRMELPEGGPRSRFLVLIPAHDEETGIATTVASCRAADYPDSLFSVLVIADNCTDRTAPVAAEAGARVVERFDEVKKSKGYAIEYLIGQLVASGEFDTLDAIIVIDADTTIDADVLRRFDAHLRAGHDWTQCYYTVSNPDQSWRTRLMTYAFSLFNGVMLAGLTALGSNAGLRGNGMCFSTRGLRRRPWASYGLSEDMEFSWMLRLDGESIAFEPSCRVYGAMVSAGGAAAVSQRRRWEFGRSEVRRTYLMPLVRSARIGLGDKLLSVLELSIPPMALLLSALVVLTALDLLTALYLPAAGSAVSWLLLSCAAIMAVAVGLYAVSPFVAMGLPWRYANALVRAPVYIAWKVLVRLGGSPASWVRTPRESSADATR
jgi:cellulose synthase/poly-beta-1,6-N-acetylglucosamine synthase-like glycosyltransferase